MKIGAKVWETGKSLSSLWIQLKTFKLTLSGAIKGNLLIYLPQVRDLDISDLEGDKIRSLEGFENLKNLERIAITQCWKVRDTKGWEILLKDYFENTILLGPLISKIVYVKKIKSWLKCNFISHEWISVLIVVEANKSAKIFLLLIYRDMCSALWLIICVQQSSNRFSLHLFFFFRDFLVRPKLSCK